MEYKTRFRPHVIVGYSMYKIEAAAQFFCIYRAAFTHCRAAFKRGWPFSATILSLVSRSQTLVSRRGVIAFSISAPSETRGAYTESDNAPARN